MYFWQKDPNSSSFAVVLAAVTALLFAFFPLSIKSINIEYTFVSLVIIVSIKSTATALIQCLLIGPKNFSFKIETKVEAITILCRALINFCLVGVLATEMPSATAIMIYFSYPIYTILFSKFAGTRLKYKDFYSIALGTLGICICVFYELEAGSTLGSIMLFIAAITNGLFLVLSDYIRPKRKSNVFALAEILCSIFIFFLLFAPEIPDLISLNGMILAGFLSGIGMYLLPKALQKIQSHEAAQILLLQPVITIVIGVLLIGENCSIYLFIGATLILYACYLRFNK